MSSIRLDNYIYTLESLREARRHLRPSGTVSVSFALTETWIQERFYRMLLEAFEQEPLCLQTPYDAGISYLVGPTANRSYIQGQADLEAMVINDRILKTETPLPTDDWPYLYLKSKSIPFAYWFTLSILFLLSAILTKKILSSREPSKNQPQKWPLLTYMFLLGAGFMLIEVKSISDLSLLYGSTWIVNSVVISAILLMILLANLFVIKLIPQSVSWVYLALTCVLGISYFLRPDTLAGMSPYLKSIFGGTITALPVFFAGILFATAFRHVEDVASAFGANLLGALVGGVLEHLSMVYGVAFLNLLGLGLYLLSMCVLYRPSCLMLSPTPRGVIGNI